MTHMNQQGKRRRHGEHHGEEVKVMRRRGNRKGQSILEYLVVAAVIVGAIIAVKGAMQTNIATLYTNAGVKTGNAATAFGNLDVEK